MADPHLDNRAPVVLERQDHGLLVLRLNRPEKFNALSEDVLDALQQALDAIAADEAARCVVLGAEGRAFCAGHDLKEMRSKPELDYYRDLFARCGRVMQSLVELPVPVIARVQGLATAAGCQLVGACDLAIAAQSARFAVSGINVGLFCSTPSVALSRNIGTKQAFDMLVTGEFIDAATAQAYGLVNEVVADADLDAAVFAKAQTILQKSPAAIRYGKALFYRQRQLGLGEAYALAGEVMARNMLEPDAREGIDAFLAKRRPKFRHDDRD